ncbi:DUF1835 domain-containing protein [Oceanobacillus piezotolerans]|uniref:DUF1835 domain-containing protein n=1 Tax=Oceanobacillus piezotolerans TaxID=2448030 RepID=A0A498DID8_9BACI|nr:DUF1835 domain-containing protein [Oceanobacillus piezotolerans]RLL48309.1 DUF1835 domain-containing protein [Oceanobacillus piezotolerans]
MIDELKRILNNSSNDEMKSLLLQTFLRLKMLEESNRYTESEFIIDLKKTYHEFLHYKSNGTKAKDNKSYKNVHILFDASSSGTLKRVLHEMKLHEEENVISFSDLFSIGPMWRLHENTGVKHRYEWIKNHLIYDDDCLDQYLFHFNNTISMINAIPKNIRITIWAGENAHEQTALRFVLYLLRERNNEISLINSTEQLKSQFNIPDTESYPLHTGEIIPEKLRFIYEKNRNGSSLSQEQRKILEEEWQHLSTTKEVLRIWQYKMIKSVDESYFDEYIINKAKKLHKQQKSKEFMKSARLIGEVIGYLDQYISDEYIEYRVRQLIMNGIFEIKGVPKAMRFYSIKLR